MFVALVIQHAMRMRHIIICGLTAAQYFSILSHKLHDIRNKQIFNTRRVLRFSLQLLSQIILGAFTKLRKVSISFVMSVGPSVCPQENNRLPLEGLQWDLIFECFSKNCRENPSLIKFGQKNGNFT